MHSQIVFFLLWNMWYIGSWNFYLRLSSLLFGNSNTLKIISRDYVRKVFLTLDCSSIICCLELSLWQSSIQNVYMFAFLFYFTILYIFTFLAVFSFQFSWSSEFTPYSLAIVLKIISHAAFHSMINCKKERICIF